MANPYEANHFFRMEQSRRREERFRDTLAGRIDSARCQERTARKQILDRMELNEKTVRETCATAGIRSKRGPVDGTPGAGYRGV